MHFALSEGRGHGSALGEAERGFHRFDQIRHHREIRVRLARPDGVHAPFRMFERHEVPRRDGDHDRAARCTERRSLTILANFTYHVTNASGCDR